MKRFNARQTYLLFILIMSVFLITGCSGGGSEGTEEDGIAGNWVAPDTTAPTVTSTVPANAATGVAINTTITATFSEAMDPLTITTTTFTLNQGATAVSGTVTYSGVTAVFTPSSNLAYNTAYTATITTGAEDLAGNALASNYVWSFTTLDTIGPTVTSTVPANAATGVAINSTVSATFSEAMGPLTITTTTFTLRQGATAVPGTVTYSGVTAVFTPSSNLAYNTAYTATITTGARDLTGNALAANYVWRFTTLDNTAPMVTWTDPATVLAPGVPTSGVPINQAISATFTEAMDESAIITAGTFTLKQGATAVTGNVDYSGVTAVFTPTSNLAFSTTYTATITTAATDLAGNPLASDYVWSFTTGAAPDTTRPTVTLTVPANAATGVTINSSVSATFSEAMDPLTIATTTFTLRQGATAISGTVIYTGVTAIFTPASNLAFSTTYTATITTGAEDLAGNALAADYVWSFTTGAAPDVTPPTVILTVPADAATGVAINSAVTATFSESMDPLTITTTTFTLEGATAVSGTVTYAGVTAVFTPVSALAFSTTYIATITTGAKDLAGNALATDYVWDFTTGAAPDTTPPTVTITNPADLEIDVAINSAVNATFSEAMAPLTISTATFTVQESGPPLGPILDGTVGYNLLTNIATFTPQASLTPGTKYTATITTGAKDLAGNALVAGAVPNPWTFTTGAVLVPTAVPLGLANTFGAFGGSAGMTNQGTLTVINGDIGTIATGATSVTGFHDTEGDIFTETGSNIGAVNGTIYTCTNSTTGPTSTGVNAAYCALATQARLDAETAYLQLAAMPSDGVLAGNLAGTTIYPGIYTNSSAVMIQGGDLTLDAQGDANAVFVFQIGSTLTVGGPGAAFPQSIILAGGAQAKNVFWQVGTAATINAGGGGTMVGTIISQAGVSFSTAGNVALVTLEGRALSLVASVTMVNTVINVPAP